MKFKDIKQGGKLVYENMFIDKDKISDVSTKLQNELSNADYVYVGNNRYYERYTYEIYFVRTEQLKDQLSMCSLSDKQRLTDFFINLKAQEGQPSHSELWEQTKAYLDSNTFDFEGFKEYPHQIVDLFERDELMPLLQNNVVFKIQNDKNNLEVLVMNKQKDLYLVNNRNATYTPYVVVTGLNKDGTWQYGSYFERYVDAYECFAEKSVDYPTCVKYLINEEMSAKGYEMDSKKVDEIYEEMMQNDTIVSPLNETIVDMIEKANDEITQTESLDEYEEEYER